MFLRAPHFTLFPYTTPLPISAGRLLNVTQKNYSGGLVLVYYCLNVQRGDRSAARCNHGSRVYRDVFCRPWNWAILKASRDRKSTRLNSSHLGISYAVFCLKKK